MSNKNPRHFTEKGKEILKSLGDMLSNTNNTAAGLTRKISIATNILKVALPTIFREYKQEYVKVFDRNAPSEPPQIMKMDRILQQGRNNKAAANAEAAKKAANEKAAANQKAAANAEEVARKRAANEEAAKKAAANEKAAANQKAANEEAAKKAANEELKKRAAANAAEAARKAKTELNSLSKSIRNAVGDNNNSNRPSGFLKSLQNRKIGLRKVEPVVNKGLDFINKKPVFIKNRRVFINKRPVFTNKNLETAKAGLRPVVKSGNQIPVNNHLTNTQRNMLERRNAMKKPNNTPGNSWENNK